MDRHYNEYKEDWEMAKGKLRELGVVYNPRTKETTYLNSTTACTSSSSISGKTEISSKETPHEFSYLDMKNGAHMVATEENSVIVAENYEDNFVLAN